MGSQRICGCGSEEGSGLFVFALILGLAVIAIFAVVIVPIITTLWLIRRRQKKAHKKAIDEQMQKFFFER